MPLAKLGIGSLTTRLSSLLVGHIRRSLPDIIREVESSSKQAEKDLQELGPGLPEDSASRRQMMLTKMNDLVSAYKNQIEGRFDEQAST
mmetsp:Transcript_8424/g.12835  ORF Transcript_8424/g.12835 Transcript_8424/m.12835 type:complete len:89 (-) Transcript_8424:1494-1760(-)